MQNIRASRVSKKLKLAPLSHTDLFHAGQGEPIGFSRPPDGVQKTGTIYLNLLTYGLSYSAISALSLLTASILTVRDGTIVDIACLYTS